MGKTNFTLAVYQSKSTVFTLNEIAMLLREGNRNALKSKVNYYVSKDVLKAVKAGIYVKPGYNKYELATKIYRPAYISLESVLSQNDMIFQYDNAVTAVSYLSREIEVDGIKIRYRKMKDEFIINTSGIENLGNFQQAGKERAFIDTLYLYRHYYFDNLSALNGEKAIEIANRLKSALMIRLVKKYF